MVPKSRSPARAPPRRKSPCAAAKPEPLDNYLLAALNEQSRQRILAMLKPVELRLGSVVYEGGQEIAQVYFPTDAIVSLLYVMEDGASAEISVVGNDGLVGVAGLLGAHSSPNLSVVQSGGWALRMCTEALRREFRRDADVRITMLRYTQALMTQIAQTAVCNRHHTIDQQLCRWLLLSLDRLSTNRLLMTQELISNMLGVRREGVTEAAGKLQRLGVIRYRRGLIVVQDRPALEKLSCECYQVVRQESDRLRAYGDCD
ncbi:MAG: Crp/Fnr family transcriptional regulator [Gammaproteobacteria bacterium]|nr:Crp/Fnr family transcriptional regulator [Gammaproteobacteria bacterium]